MRRLLILGVAVFLGGFHEWTPPAHAARLHPHVLTCFDEEQFPETFALDNQPPPTTFLVGVDGEARFSCTVNWRVTFQPLYQDAAGWHVGFDNPLIFPNPTGHYQNGVSVTFFPPSQPAGFTGYWTNGDGLRAAHPICRWAWRVRERFTNTGNDTTTGTYYSPTQAPTC